MSPVQTSPAPLLDALTLAFLRTGSDTSAARLLKELVSPGGAGLSPDDPGLPWALVERLDVAPGRRASRLEQARQAAELALAETHAAGLQAIAWHDPSYPPLLGCIPDPPIALWYRGDLAVLSRPAVAVIGSRAATPSGLLMARKLGRGLADAGLVVVSGMARGVDGAAHEGALEAGGPSIGVLGCGVDVIYPPEHAALSRQLAATGILTSELPPGSPPFQWHFPLRNRIISGLSIAVVVVEASERSGSLITAKAALDQGRDVLAVPGGAASGRYRGSHGLIKDGARLVETVDDVLDEIRWRPPAPPAPAATPRSLRPGRLEATMAVGETYTLDDLVSSTGRAAASLLAELGQLEMRGRISRAAGGGYVRLDGREMVKGKESNGEGPGHR